MFEGLSGRNGSLQERLLLSETQKPSRSRFRA